MSMCDLFLTARMLGRHAYITLTCHLLAANLLCVAHPRIRNQTVRTRYPQEQQEDGCRYDLVNEFHWISIIDAFGIWIQRRGKSYMLSAKKLADHR
jgi:hypothetical protein